ncbi:MAG TPA: DUF3363 domain-containing protein [Rhizomicrobium sp.]
MQIFTSSSKGQTIIGLGFQLVPWRPAIEQQLGRQVTGVITSGGGVAWDFGRSSATPIAAPSTVIARSLRQTVCPGSARTCLRSGTPLGR